MAKDHAYDIAVALMPADGLLATASDGEEQPDSTVPGFEDAFGTKGSERRSGVLIERGEEAVLAASDAIARQIGTAAARIAMAIEDKTEPMLNAENINMESIEITFGIALSAGVTTVFTAQGESSVEVTLRLSPKTAQK